MRTMIAGRVAALILLTLVPAAASVASTGPAGAKPGDIAIAFYEAANEGRCNDAKAYLTRTSLELIERTLSGSGGFETFCRSMAGSGALQDTLVTEETIGEDRAEFCLWRTYASGAGLNREILTKTAAGWRLLVEQVEATETRPSSGCLPPAP